MEQEYSFKNLFQNMNRRQKIGLAVFVVVVVILIAVLTMMAGTLNEMSDGESDNGEEAELVEQEATETAEGVSGGILSNGPDSNENITVPIKTNYDETHEYSLIEYLPVGKYNVEEGDESEEGVVAYYYIEENTAIDNGIVITVDSCNVEENQRMANDYLKSLPVDLSGYIIVYQTDVSDLPCE